MRLQVVRLCFDHQPQQVDHEFGSIITISLIKSTKLSSGVRTVDQAMAEMRIFPQCLDASALSGTLLRLRDTLGVE